MTKKEAAEYLGISVKTLEKYMGQKRIGFNRVSGKHGIEVDFNQEELERFKNEKQVVAVPAIAQESSNSMILATPTTLSSNGQSIANSTNELVAILKDLTKELSQQNQQNKTNLVGIKLTLSLAEASQLAGLSKNYLKKAIDGGELKAAKRGKGWNIKRSDLEMWVEGL